MQQPDHERPPAVAHGASLGRSPHFPEGVVASLAAIVADHPDGQIVSLQLNGADRSATFLDLWRESTAIAAHLQGLGLQTGHPVVLLVQDVLDFVPAFWACLHSGVMAAPMNGAAAEALHERGGATLRGALALLPGAVLLTDDHFLPLARSLAAELGSPIVTLATAKACTAPLQSAAPSEPLYLIPTSGSSGRLKLAALGHDTVYFRSLSERRPAEINPAPCLGVVAHDNVSGLRVAFLPHRTWVQMPGAMFMARPLSVLDAIERFQIVSTGLTSSLMAQILAAREKSSRRWSLASLRRIGVGSETVVRQVLRRFNRLVIEGGGPDRTIVVGYGATETGLLVASREPVVPGDDEDDFSPMPLGFCQAGVSLRIADEQDQVLVEGEAGEVQIFCPQVFLQGYWGEPGALEANITADGWWRSGDVGSLVAGELTLLGRKRDILVVRAKKYALPDVDGYLNATLGRDVRTFSCAILWPGEATERLAIAFVPSDDARPGDFADEIRRLVANQFGLRPDPVIVARLDQIPFTATGKLKRGALAELIRGGSLAGVRHAPIVAQASAPGPRSMVTRARLVRLWQEILQRDADLSDDSNFFDLGGDSLRSAQLFFRVEEEFGSLISVSEFFADPVFAAMLCLVEGQEDEGRLREPPADGPNPWPLPPDLKHRLLSYFETWDGHRPTEERLVAGLNTAGTKPPLFWVFQEGDEFSALARCLGPDQPLYALRSAVRIAHYTEDTIQRLALSYAHEIQQVCSDGPFFIGGNCQGGIIALAVAQHMLRRKRHVPLLILMEWGFPVEPYAGPVLLAYGRDSTQGNPYLRHRNPRLAWRRIYQEFRTAEIPGGHGAFFVAPNVAPLAQILAVHMDEALGRPPRLLPQLAYQARLRSPALPSRLAPGERRLLEVTVENASPVAWTGWEQSGLSLGNYWVDDAGDVVVRLDGRTALPALAPGEKTQLTLAITAPGAVGAVRLMIDLVEEGGAWFQPIRAAALQALVIVADGGSVGGPPTELCATQ